MQWLVLLTLALMNVPDKDLLLRPGSLFCSDRIPPSLLPRVDKNNSNKYSPKQVGAKRRPVGGLQRPVEAWVSLIRSRGAFKHLRDFNPSQRSRLTRVTKELLPSRITFSRREHQKFKHVIVNQTHTMDWIVRSRPPPPQMLHVNVMIVNTVRSTAAPAMLHGR